MAMKGGNGVTYTNDTKQAGRMRFENPFALKIGQVFTGFGIGCGIGIGYGRPLNLGAIPVLNQVMVATRGATDAFSGVQVHINNSLRKVGAKNIEAGFGCGVGFGHGFGVGLALKPSVLHQIQSQAAQVAAQLMKKLGVGSDSLSSVNQGILPASLQTGMNMVKEPSHENSTGDISQFVKSVSNNTHNGNIRGERVVVSEHTVTPESSESSTQYSSRTETVLNNFLQNPILKEGISLQEKADPLQLENKILQMVLKHQLLIDELMQENEKLHQILVEDLKVHPNKLQSTFISRSKSTCAECFECRRKQRRR
ncbi:uncharacterized protein LOC127240251 [Andrographis paniculata]|uniref:uncharacterized protein LOC127240251 n=1 Tax=Andrographis paniculata TaxID=175694 RepID=UPI0021E840E1|nr:uncharacterized protein LOC127240251 [Andrographis paniculata]